MPNWSVHILLPLLILLVISKKENLKYIIFLLPLSIIPDADVLFSQHRGLLHNIFAPLAILIMAYLWKSKRTPILIALFYISSHLFFDIFNGGIALFYPLYNGVFFIDINFLLLNPSLNLSASIKYGIHDTFSAMTSYKYNYIISDSIGVGVIIFTLLALFYKRKNL